MMNEAVEIIRRAFDPEGFPPRWYCGNWTSTLGWLHISSDFLIFVSYVAIPVLLVFFAMRRPDVPFHKILILFAAFIICCGIGHLLEAVIFWHPIYRFAGMWKLLTGVVSMATVLAMIPIIPKVLTIPGIIRDNKDMKTALQMITTLRKNQEDIAYGAAHCLKEPVRALNYRLSTLLEDYQTKLPKGIQVQVEESQKQTERLHEMIEEMVMHANLMSAKVNLAPVDLESEIKRMISTEVRGALAKKVTFISNCAESPAPRIDQTLFRWSLKNCLKIATDSADPLTSALEVELRGRGLSDTSSEGACYEVLFVVDKPRTTSYDLKNEMGLFTSPDYCWSLSVADRALQRMNGGVEVNFASGQKSLCIKAFFSELPAWDVDTLVRERI